MTRFDSFLQERLKDKALKAEYDALALEFTIIRAMNGARETAGITRKQLAQRTGINQEG